MKKLIFIITLFIFNSISFAQQNNFIVAENYYRNGEYEKATQFYKELCKKSPYNSTYTKRLISCYQETNQFSMAEGFINERINQYPNQTYLYVILGYTYERQQLSEKAEKQYQKALTAIKNKNNYGGVIASLFKEYSKLDHAITAYNNILVNNPKANYGFQLAQIYGEKGDFEKMFASYIDLVDKNERFLNNVKHYAAKYINEDPENKHNILFKRALLKKSISNPKNIWNDILAWLFIKQKQYPKALIQYKALLARNQESLRNIQLLGTIAFENKDYETAEACAKLIIEKTNHIPDKFSAIEMILQIGVVTNKEAIEQEFEKTLSEFGINRNTLLIQLAYADFLTFSKNNPEKGIDLLEKSMKVANTKRLKATVRLKLGEILVFTQKFNKALIYFSQVQSKFKNHSIGQEARFKVAQTSYYKHDFKWAKAQLKVLKSGASQLIANDATELFLTISDNEPKDSLPTGLKEYAKADLLSYQKKHTEAIKILAEVITKYQSQPIEDEALYKQALLLTEEGQYDKAVANFEKILALNPEGIFIDNSLYHLGDLYLEQLNNPKKASEYYQKIIFDHASSIFLVDARKKFRKIRGDNI